MIRLPISFRELAACAMLISFGPLATPSPTFAHKLHRLPPLSETLNLRYKI